MSKNLDDMYGITEAEFEAHAKKLNEKLPAAIKLALAVEMSCCKRGESVDHNSKALLKTYQSQNELIGKYIDAVRRKNVEEALKNEASLFKNGKVAPHVTNYLNAYQNVHEEIAKYIAKYRTKHKVDDIKLLKLIHLEKQKSNLYMKIDKIVKDKVAAQMFPSVHEMSDYDYNKKLKEICGNDSALKRYEKNRESHWRDQYDRKNTNEPK